jgi:glycogen debranching enzyme
VQPEFSNDDREWLEPDGLGGFASGTVSGIRTRRYHALLLTATTPPTGKPVEVQALWLHALAFASTWDSRWQVAYVRGRINFARRFWNSNAQCLYDVVDVDHVPGRLDASCRPNQIFAIGGLGESLLDTDRTGMALGVVERKLLTPLGLRSLAADEAGYVPHYGGGPRERDGAYHQGTVWPWLIGSFVDAWLAARGRTEAAKGEARLRFLRPLERHLEEAGLGHVSEIADAEPPFTPRGCPFQAWSVGEMLRGRAMVDSDSERRESSADVRRETRMNRT